MLWNGGVPGTSSVIRFFVDVYAWISLLAGAFDVLENLALIQLMLGSELTVWNGMSRWSALAKFGLLLSVMGWLMYIGFRRFSGRGRRFRSLRRNPFNALRGIFPIIACFMQAYYEREKSFQEGIRETRKVSAFLTLHALISSFWSPSSY